MNAPISWKYAVEMSHEFKGKHLNKVELHLRDIMEEKRHLPLRKYNGKVAHRRGRAVSGTKAGRYPKNASKIILGLLYVKNTYLKNLKKTKSLTTSNTSKY